MTITWASLFAALALSLGVSGAARAEIEVIVPAGAKFVPPFNAPKLPLVPGWETNLAASVASQSRILEPAGGGGRRPSAMIRVRTLPKSMAKSITSLDQLVTDDHIDRRARDPGAEITEIPAVTDKAGHRMRVFAERSGNRRLFGMAAYAEEQGPKGEPYWTLFTLSADSQDALASAAGPFQDLLRNYQ